MIIEKARRIGSKIESTINMHYTITVVQVSICAVTIITSFIFAATVSFWYDESYTYLYYVYPSIKDAIYNSIHGVQLLNNHIMNTLLIRLSEYITGVQYNEFVIRLPNLIAHIVYAIFVILLSKEFSHKILFTTLLMCNWELTRYFGMARGYGLATCGVLAALYFLYQWIYKSQKFYIYILCMIFLCFAALSNAITLYISLPILFIFIYFIIKYNTFYILKSRFNIIFAMIFICLIIFTFYAAQEGKPKYTTHEFYNGFLFSLPIMFTPRILFDDIILIIFTLIFTCGFIYSKKRIFHIILLGYIGISILSNLIFNKGYPFNRELLPVYPVVILSIMASIEKIKIKYIYFIFSLFLFVQYILNISFNDVGMLGETDRSKVKIMSYIAKNDITNERKELYKLFNPYNSPTGQFYINKFYYKISNK